MKTLNAGIIGMGFIGMQHLRILSSLPGVRVAGICASDKKKLMKIKEDYGIPKITDDWRELTEDPEIDVIHNCMPNHLHDAVNLSAIAHGKHVYSEKPLSCDSASAFRVMKAGEEAGTACAVNYQYRMNAAVREMKSRVGNGECGRILYVSGGYLQDSASRITDYSKRQMPETSQARALLDLGVHWADTVCCVTGSQISSVYARMITHYPVRKNPADNADIMIHSDDTASVMVRFRSGTEGSAIFSKCMPGHKNDLCVAVSGSESEYLWKQEECGFLYMGEREGGNRKVYIDGRTAHQETAPYVDLPAGHEPGWHDAFFNAVKMFYNSLSENTYRNKNQPYATFRDGWRGNCFVDACLKSAAEGTWVSTEGEI